MAGVLICPENNDELVARVGSIPTASAKYDRMAEWLGVGLQNRLREFDSLSCLQIMAL